jgi:outer membrane immunogenic protein
LFQAASAWKEMMRLKRFAAGAGLALACPVALVQAADAITVPTSTPAEMPIYETATFDWSGFYAGVYGGLQNSGAAGQVALGLQAGINADFGFYLLGGEIAVHGLAEGEAEVGNSSYGQILGRAGLIVSDNVLVYAAGGYGIDLGAPENGEALIGAGVEVAVSDTISLDAQYLRGFPLGDGEQTDQITFGANFHF